MPIVVPSSGTSVQMLNHTTNRFVKATGSWIEWPTRPSPELYNDSIKWLEDLLKKWNTGLTIVFDPQANLNFEGGSLVAHLMSGGTTQRHEMGMETVCVATTDGTLPELEQQLKGELRAAGLIIP